MLQISKDAEILKILSHHILWTHIPESRHWSSFEQEASMAASFNSSTSGCTVITPHLGRGPNRQQAFGPSLCVCVSVCTHTFAWVDELCSRCVFVSVCGPCVCVSVTVATSSWAESVAYITAASVPQSHSVSMCSHFLILCTASCGDFA